MARLTFVVFCILLQSSFPQGNNNFFQQTDHIPLAVMNWGGYLSYDYKMIDSMGADALIVDNLTPAIYNHIRSGAPNLKLIPYTTGTLTNDLICQYSEGMYNEWGVVDDSIEGKYQFANDLSKVEITGDTVKTKTNAGEGEIIYGPGEWYKHPDSSSKFFYRGYPQQSRFLLGIDSLRTIMYNCNFKLRIGKDPYYQQDTLVPVQNNQTEVCTLRVGYLKAGKEGDEFTPIAEKILVMHDFEEYDEWISPSFSNSYTWINTQTTEKEFFIANTEATRNYQLRTEIQIKFSGYPYINLYVCKIVNYDMDRGSPLITMADYQDNIRNITENIKPDSSGYIYSNGGYDSTVISWYAVDEPGSFDNFMVLRKIDSLMSAASNGKRRLYMTLAGCYNGTTGKNIQAHKSLLEGTGGGFYTTLQKYIMETPYQSLSQSITDPPYRSLDICNWANIAHFIVNIEQFAKYDSINGYTKPFGLMLQTGKWDAILLRSPTIPQFLYMANMGLMYGAKLLALNNYFCSNERPGLIAIYNLSTSVYSGLWKTIKDTLSPRLKGLLGKTLKNLYQSGQITGINAFTTTDNINHSILKYVHCPTTVELVCSLDVGFFNDINSSKHYFYLVNRHYSEINNIEIGFQSLNNYNNWTLKNYVDSSATTIVKDPNNRGIHNDTILPGDGILYSIAPTVKYGGEINSDETVTNESLSENDLIVKNGATLTINGTYNCHKSILVDTGGKLKIIEGSTLSFSGGAKLIVSGRLTAKGDNSPITFNFGAIDADSANGIVLQESSYDTLINCKILNAHTGIKIDASAPYIDFCEITNSQNGMVLADAYYDVENDTGTIIKEMQITNCATGIHMESSSAFLSENHTDSCIVGIRCVDGSFPIFGEWNQVGLNRITGEDTGIVAVKSGIILGMAGNPLFAGYNDCLSENTLINASEESYVYGNYVWWGMVDSTFDTGKFVTDNGSYIDYDYYLNESATGYGESRLRVNQPKQQVLTKEAEEGLKENNLTLREEFREAIRHYLRGEGTEARSICRSIIQNNRDSLIALTALRLIANTINTPTIRDSVRTYLTQEGNSSVNNIDFIVNSKVILAELDGTNFIESINAIISRYPNTSEKDYLLYKKFSYYYFRENKRDSALSILSEMETAFPEGIYTKIAKELTVGNKLQKSQNESGTGNIKKIELVNYPNPFNPVTTIKYTVLSRGEVNLSIFNILGERLKEIVNETEDEGIYKVNVDMSRFSSGVYIYRIITPDYSLSKKMILVK